MATGTPEEVAEQTRAAQAISCVRCSAPEAEPSRGVLSSRAPAPLRNPGPGGAYYDRVKAKG